ncbi:MAG: hypothetical protein JST09_15050 [Bacteroidetes bacterium]|nr:hypothetical protein [Bacteroidota bacterium]
MNSLNYYIGSGKLYPFIIPPALMKKIKFIQTVDQIINNNFLIHSFTK